VRALDDIIRREMYGPDNDGPSDATRVVVKETAPPRDVEALARQMRELMRIVEDQGRTIRRLQSRVTSLEHALKKHGHAIRDVERDLDNKLDRL
jgi:hypothetical protein